LVAKKHINKMNSNENKAQVYKKWLDNGRPWFDIDKSKEPTYAERQIILEMKKRENTKSNELEQSRKYFSELYAKNQGKIPRTFPKTIFD
jgi:hypothetical protein